jgi:hypothetical protein
MLRSLRFAEQRAQSAPNLDVRSSRRAVLVMPTEGSCGSGVLCVCRWRAIPHTGS